ELAGLAGVGVPMGLEGLGTVNPCLGAPGIGLILGALGKVAVEQQVLLIVGSDKSRGEGDKRQCAEENCGGETWEPATGMPEGRSIQFRIPPACSHMRA